MRPEAFRAALRLAAAACLLALAGCAATPAPVPPVAAPAATAEAPADARAVSAVPAPASPLAATRGTASRLPPDHARLVQAPPPLAARTAAMHGVPGLRLGRFQGLEALLVETPHATAAVALHGGHLLSYRPAGQEDVLWLSPLTALPPAPIRGGTPVLWPYFGRQDQDASLPAHGLVRTLPWTLAAARREGDGSVLLELVPPPMPGLPLRLRMELRIGRTLEQRLATENAGDAPVRYTQALHNYFRISDVAAVRGRGLDGLTYLDKADGYSAHVQQGDWVLHGPRDPGRSDRLYGGGGGRYALIDPGLRRRVDIAVQGARTLIVWNPGAQGERTADIGPHWRRFLCLEPASAGPEVVELAPGQRHELVQTIATAPL